MTGIIGKKIGMTQLFDGDGNLVAVTVIEAGPCPVTLVRTVTLSAGAASFGASAAQTGLAIRKAINPKAIVKYLMVASIHRIYVRRTHDSSQRPSSQCYWGRSRALVFQTTGISRARLRLDMLSAHAAVCLESGCKT